MDIPPAELAELVAALAARIDARFGHCSYREPLAVLTDCASVLFASDLLLSIQCPRTMQVIDFDTGQGLKTSISGLHVLVVSSIG